MPDVSRSDSTRSDASRPRVSFNRDVHVKRINGPRTASAYSLTPDGTALAPTAVRRERPKTKRQMTKEAEDVLKQVDKYNCIAAETPNDIPIKPKKKLRRESFLQSFRKQDKDKPKTSSSELDSASSNEKDNRKNNFMSLDRKKLKKEKKNKNLEYLSIDETAKTKSKPKVNCDMEDEKHSNKKKQLSPIIESPVIEYPEVRKENNIEKMIKKLTERSAPRVDKTVGSGLGSVKSPGVDNCHNDNKPFSYLNGSAEPAELEMGLAKSDQIGRNLDGGSGSPMDDVIYAQVVVSGRDGSARKKTVHTRVSPSVGSQPNSAQGGIDCADGDMWRRTDHLYGENPGRRDLYRRKSVDSDRDVKTPSPFFDCGYTTRVRVEPTTMQTRSRVYDKSPSNLHDLSMRREILLSRSESQAKERFNSLKRISEPTTTRQVNGLRNNSRSRYNDNTVNEKFSTSQRKASKNADLATSRKTEPKMDGYVKEKEETWKNNERVHTARHENNLLQRLSRLGKSKSFIDDTRPRTNRIDKVKMLFRKKKEGKGSGSDEDALMSRYTEYRGSDLDLSDTNTKRNNLYSDSEQEYTGRKRLNTPSSSRNSYDSGTMTAIKNMKNRGESNWFKSLDRLKKKTTSRYRNKGEGSGSEISTSSKPSNLRFFGDTDQESVTTEQPNLGHLKMRYGLDRGHITESEEETLLPSRSESRLTDSTLKGSTIRYKSRYDLDRPDYGVKQMSHGLNMPSNKYDYNSSNLSDTSTLKNCNYDFNLNGMKYGPNISRSMSSVTNSSRYDPKEKLRPLKSNPVITVTKPGDSLSRRIKSRSQGNLYSGGDRRRTYDSSAESTTEGDSGHSTKSMIYLHAATVGDIPGHKGIYRPDSRSRSREELSSIGETSTSVVGNRKTLSRSISVLAPWRPKHYKQDSSLHYDSGNGSDFGRGKPPVGPRSHSRERKPSELRFNTLGKENRRQKDLLR